MAGTTKKADNTTISARLRRLDPVLVLAALALSGVGLLAVYIADTDYRNFYASNQAMGLAAGLVLATPLALVNYQRWQRHLRWIYGLTVLMLLAVLAVGFAVHGAKSWIDVGPVQIQPSEFAKPLTIVVLAGYVAENSFAEHQTFFKALGIVVVPVLLVLAQPDLGTAMVSGLASLP